MKTSEELIREKIEKIFKESPAVHMDVSLSRPRLQLSGAEAVITGVYPHIFMIEETSCGFKKSHTLRYTELLTDKVVIRELKLCKTEHNKP